MANNTYIYSDLHKGLKISSRGDVTLLYDADAVIQSIKTIMATVTGERLRNPLGSTLVGLLFQPLNKRTSEGVKDEIRRVIGKYEPRVNIVTLTIQADIDAHIYDIQIEYDIIGLSGRYNFETKLKSFGV